MIRTLAPRHLLDPRRAGRPDRQPRLVIDVNEDVCCVWSPEKRFVAEHSRGPFARDASQDGLEAAFLSSLLEQSGIDSIIGIPVFLPLGPSAAQEERNPWCRAIRDLGGDVIVIHRPVAAATALGLEVDESSCHLMVEVLRTAIDLAIVRAGSVSVSHRFERSDFGGTRRFVQESLATLDPDEELEIRDRGVAVYGWSALRHVRETISAVGLPLAGPVGRGPTVLNGAKAIADEVLPWLAAR